MSHTGGEALGATVALSLLVAAVFWLCGIVHLQRLVFGKDEVSDLDGPLDGMHMAMAAYMAFMFWPGYSGVTDAPAAAAFLLMAAALVVRTIRHRADDGKALRCAMAATGAAGMSYMLLADSGNGNAVGVALALLLAACTAAHLGQFARALRHRMGPGSQSPLVRAGQVASAAISTGMVIMLLQL